ncbi:NAD(P)/FAD-dependent oxidoreductase [Marinimicrobium sp. ARAG 43.8]|uniref:NAD(P)/FAD-dependent oxidoreductase n=1 Tax=Marinimicrobium sp. ARAG 43.8 TaxID=3418719 RepID=UPI003CEDAB51
MNTEVVIIGGSFAGLAAAMPLVRAQRQVRVIDANTPRNRFADASHGIFCLDGKTPGDIRATALTQLQAYPTFDLIEGTATNIEQTRHGFAVITGHGVSVNAQRIILATGITDTLPDIPGIKEHWGKSVIHCPYCHGYELKDRHLGVLATSEMSFHQAAMIPDWGATTLFTQGLFEPNDDTLKHLQSRGVSLERTPIVEVSGNGVDIHEVTLADNRRLPVEGLYVGPKITLTSPLIDQLGLTLEETPMGSIVQVDALKESSLKGVFVAGDLSNAMQNGTFAIASGTMAGVAAHRSLIFES